MESRANNSESAKPPDPVFDVPPGPGFPEKDCSAAADPLSCLQWKSGEVVYEVVREIAGSDNASGILSGSHCFLQ